MTGTDNETEKNFNFKPVPIEDRLFVQFFERKETGGYIVNEDVTDFSFALT
jgi:hypothetical protein